MVTNGRKRSEILRVVLGVGLMCIIGGALLGGAWWLVGLTAGVGVRGPGQSPRAAAAAVPQLPPNPGTRIAGTGTINDGGDGEHH